MKNKILLFWLSTLLGACGTNNSYDLRFEANADGRYRLVSDNPCGEKDFSWRATEFSVDLTTSESGDLGLDVFTPPGTYEGEFFCDLVSQGDLTITVLREASGDLKLSFDDDNFDITTTLEAFDEAIACRTSPCVLSVPQSQPLSLSIDRKNGQQDLDCAIVCGEKTISTCLGQISLPSSVRNLACEVNARPKSNTATLIVDAGLSVTSDDAFVETDEGLVFAATPARAIVRYSGDNEIRWLGHCAKLEEKTAVVQMNTAGIFRCTTESTTPASGSVEIEIQIASSGDELDGTIVASGAELECNGSRCDATAHIGAIVTLRAISETGADFAHWGACASLGTVDGAALRFEVTEALVAQGQISCIATFSRNSGCPGGEPPRPVFTIVDEEGVTPPLVDGVYQMVVQDYVIDASDTPYVGQQGFLRWEVSVDRVGILEESQRLGWYYEFNMASFGIIESDRGTLTIIPINCDETEGEPVVVHFETRF